MLKLYAKLEDVPEALREHYKLSDGRYVPDLSEDHPVLAHNKTLLTEKSQATAKVRELEADMAEAKTSGIPRGHVAVAKADAELIDKYKALGKPDELSTTLNEHKELKGEVTRRQREDGLKQVAKELGYNEEAFVRLPNLPDFEVRDKDGKKTVVAKIKNGETVTERPATEFMESSPDHAPFLPALKSTDGVSVHGSRKSSGEAPQSVFDKIRSEVKDKQQAQKTQLHPMFQKIAGRVPAQSGE